MKLTTTTQVSVDGVVQGNGARDENPSGGFERGGWARPLFDNEAMAFVQQVYVVLADAGYWHQRQIEAVVSDGMQVLVPPDAGLRKGTRPGWTGGLYDFMRRVLATPDGRALYRQRQITIEPVFGQIKFNRAIRRFQRRGRSACRSEWRFIAATHNLLKLHHHRLAAIPA